MTCISSAPTRQTVSNWSFNRRSSFLSKINFRTPKFMKECVGLMKKRSSNLPHNHHNQETFQTDIVQLQQDYRSMTTEIEFSDTESRIHEKSLCRFSVASSEQEFFDAFENVDYNFESFETLNNTPHQHEDEDRPPVVPYGTHLALISKEINQVCDETWNSVSLQDGSISANEEWTLLERQGELYVYESKVESCHCGALLALNTITGFTAKEICDYFWNIQHRMKWEHIIDFEPQIIEMSHDTFLIHNIYKRVWPTLQRDGFFWSKLIHKNNNICMVVNHSTDYIESSMPPLRHCAPIRVQLHVVMVCETIIPTHIPVEELQRSDVTCKVFYTAKVNPGGFAPTWIVRSVTRKEGTRFLKKFSQFVIDETKNKPLLL